MTIRTGVRTTTAIFEPHEQDKALDFMNSLENGFMCRLYDEVNDKKKVVGWYVWSSDKGGARAV